MTTIGRRGKTAMSKYDSIPNTLRDWLATATRGLASWDKDRIEREIRAHYEDAVVEGLEEGLAKADAHFKALDSLGDPKQAHKRNIRTNSLMFTEIELKELITRYGNQPEFSWKNLSWKTVAGIAFSDWRLLIYQLFFLTIATILFWLYLFVDLSFYIIPTLVFTAFAMTEVWTTRILIPRRLREQRPKLAFCVWHTSQWGRIPATFIFFISIMHSGKTDLSWVLTWFGAPMILLWMITIPVTLFLHMRQFPKDLSRDDVLKG
jgi:hypothetical protein